MPNRNGMGPGGMGSMTGRGAGSCTGFSERRSFRSFNLGRMNRGFSRGFYGRGFQGNFASNEMSKDNLSDYLNNRAVALETELESIKLELKEIDSENKDQK